MADQIRAPWTSEQVAALNAFQLRGGMHPFTCSGDHTHDSPALIAYTDGWRCPQPYGESCDYRQDWAHAFMAEPQRVTHSCGQEPHTWGCVTTVDTDTITVDNPRNTGWYWTCTACDAGAGKYSTDDQARAQAAIDHPQCPPDPNGPYAWTIPAATEATETPDPTHGLSVQHADALWDAIAIPGPRTPTFVEQHDRACRTVAAIIREVTPPGPEEPALVLEDVQGRCPTCGNRTLFLGDGGYITCSLAECPNPSAAHEAIEERARANAYDRAINAPPSAAACAALRERLASGDLPRRRVRRQPKPVPAGLRDQLAAAIWERQNPGRRYTDCEHPWQADAEADADAVLAALTLRLDFGEEQAWCKTCRRAWHGTDHRCESEAEQAVTRVRHECDRLEAAVRDNPTTPDFDGAYLTAIGHVRTALTPPQEPTP